MQQILVTGASGQMGKALKRVAQASSDHVWTFIERNALDIRNAFSIEATISAHHPDFLINCAAYTAVDRAESEIDLAFEINEEAVKVLSDICLANNTHLIHYSTDYVYGGEANIPILETALPAPQGVYAQSKLAGDLAIENRATIIRTSWLYGPDGHNFVKTMLRLGKERKELSVVFDQVGTPTLVDDLAGATCLLIKAMTQSDEIDERFKGVFHYSNEGVASWYDFAQAIFDIADINCRLLPIHSAEYPTPADRPAYSVLDKSKIKRQLGIHIPHWRESLKKMLAQLG